MKAVVDQDSCTGCGICVDTCPDVFEIDGDTATVTADPVPEEFEADVRQAAEHCPVEAISVE